MTAEVSKNAVDELLLQRLRAADPKAIEALWTQEQPRLLSVARRILSHADAEDLVQEVLLDFCYNYVRTIRHAESVAAYLRLMVTRRAVRRKQEGQRYVESALEEGHESATEPPVDMRRLRACLNHITPHTQKVLRLYYGHGFSCQTISETLGNTKQAVSKAMRKALESLRQCLEQSSEAACDAV